MVALPARRNEAGELEMLEDVLAFAATGHIRDFNTWFDRTSKIWDERKKTDIALNERYDYHRLLTRQNVKDSFRVLYGASGTHVASCVLETEFEDFRVYRRRVSGFVVDTTCYYYTAQTEAEAHYLCAILNSKYVNQQIEAHQPEGLWGARHIHRTPFEACAIPIFEPNNTDHQELARLSQVAHALIEELKGMEENRLLNGGPGRVRNAARKIVAEELAAIDVVTRRIIAD